MEYATLGNTGLVISKLRLGTRQHSGTAVGQAGADELVKTSTDGGVNFFETADNYT